MAKTKKLDIRIDEDLLTSVTTKAAAEGVTISELIRNWLSDYADDTEPVLTELHRIIRRLSGIGKRLDGDNPVYGSVWPS